MVGGDFNAQPHTQVVEAFLAKTGRVDLLEQRDAQPTRGNRRIDYLMGSVAIDERVIDAYVFEARSSDHDAVAVTVSSSRE